jgi:hypothetical protein
MTTQTQEQKEWIKKLHTMLMPGISYPPNPTPHQRSLRYKRGVEYVLEDDGETIFKLEASSRVPSAPNISTILYSRTKVWEEQLYSNINRQFVICPEHKRYYNSFVSVMKRYRKEYRKHFLRKCVIPQAKLEKTRSILFEETQLPEEILRSIVSYVSYT